MSRRRGRADRREGVLIVAVAAAVIAGTVALGRRATRPDPAPAAEDVWTCACGARYRFTGAGRHQVFWPAGAPDDEPLLEQRCPSCSRPLGDSDVGRVKMQARPGPSGSSSASRSPAT